MDYSFNIIYSLNFNEKNKPYDSLMKDSGIYIIQNIINKKIYIGSSIYFKRRFQRHRTALLKNIHNNKHLQNSWNKYSIYNFTFNIIEIISKDKLIEREQYWINLLKPYELEVGYNIDSIVGPTHNLGKSPSLETRRKISNSLLGTISPKRGISLSEEIKLKISRKVKSLGIKGNRLPQSKKVEIINIINGNKQIYESLSEAQFFTKIDRSTMRKYSRTNKILHNMYIINII